MERYNYHEAVKNDILDYIRDNYTPEEIREKLQDRDNFAEELNDDLWTADSVTGNGSGSYTFSRAEAKDYVTDNPDELREALKEFCVEAETIANNFLNEEWEYFDVTIRCYWLGAAISEALDELEKEYPPEEEYDFDIFCGKFAGCQNCPFYNFQTVDECREAFEKRKAEKDGEQ